MSRPPLSVVVPVREGLAEVEPVLTVLVPSAEAFGVEVVVVGALDPTDDPPAECVRLVSFPDPDMLALHRRGISEAAGEVVAIGEDHAVPRPDWVGAVIRAHAEHPEAAAIAGCLVNATDATLAGRANFLAFAAPWQPPMPTLPVRRPPPASTLSFKREVLAEAGSQGPGWLEGKLIPSLFAAGQIVADERIVVDHHQDHGRFWSVLNAFHSARSSYGFERTGLDPAGRRKVARWALRNVPAGLRREAREGAVDSTMSVRESILVTAIVTAAGIGAIAGTMLGPGSSGARVA